jgi:hypothetical protein
MIGDGAGDAGHADGRAGIDVDFLAKTGFI